MKSIKITPKDNKPSKIVAKSRNESSDNIEIANIIILDDWAALYCPTNTKYTPPEHFRFRLTGKATGHPEFKNGSTVTSSPVISVIRDIDDDQVVIGVQSGRFYRLGSINADYERAFPDARNRLIDAIAQGV